MTSRSTQSLERQEGGRKKMDLQRLLTMASLIVLLLFFIIYGSAAKGINISSFLMNVLESAYYIGFLAMGVTFVIVTGGIDLSVGTIMMCGALIGGVAYNVWGWPMVASLILVVCVATGFGLLNGVLVSRLKLVPFIATMGSMMISQGLGSIISQTQTMRYPTMADPDGWFKEVFLRTQGGFPTGIFWLAGFFIIAWFLLNKTRFGKYTFAIGSNEEAARLSGIDTKKWLTLDYVVDGLFCGFAGIFYAATYTTVIPGSGNGLELQAIAGVVIGGTSLSGGVGTMSGTMIGVFIMAVLRSGLMAISVPQQWQTLLIGVVVILAVLLDIYRQNNAKKA